MSFRLFTPLPLAADSELSLPSGPARHAQVRRVQPGDTLWLFDGLGADWPATVLAMGKSEVRVRVGAPVAVARELPLAVTLALAMPANERMDTLVEKATELGVARIQPLHGERSVLRLSGERAARKQAHWQAIAEAACEQCGRARVPLVAPVLGLSAWLALQQATHQQAAATGPRLLLSLRDGAAPVASLVALTALDAGDGATLHTLSGPEGGFTPEEESAALAAGYLPTDLGPRVLRADTAPLAVLAWLALQVTPPRPR